ncbi:rhodanese-like domain protein [Ketogulonicigenium robustum]|uniref:tRNA uridine(34) hydroxylase n=1 Tax=Ketogulonicigenium robustum TaxID=92947 RepID=A0A1W6P2P8_9RHOB|nr:rhodanese-related sulfurtransferase [Ketogulonicigenium robustum]ARO15785.1 rhodanese-like domain protein [Ketogulonicigenium robustum]
MFTVAALYHFTRFEDHVALRAPLLEVCRQNGICGTLLLAAEGINGTVAGPRAGIDALIAHIRALPGCDDLVWKESTASEQPFLRMKVRLKQEIVTMGQPDVNPLARTGHYVAPADWNALISAPDVAVIDTRNDYEVAIGTFEGAVDPQTKAFSDFPAWWAEHKHEFAGKRIAMFCTGGIRCEKSTNFLLNEGVSDVYHLQGGILKYLEDVPADDSMWQGECFVFDGRVALKHGLEEGEHTLCHACRMPLSAADRALNSYEEGVSCRHCITTSSDADKARFRERQKQIALAKKRGEHHLGQDITPLTAEADE